MLKTSPPTRGQRPSAGWYSPHRPWIRIHMDPLTGWWWWFETSQNWSLEVKFKKCHPLSYNYWSYSDISMSKSYKHLQTMGDVSDVHPLSLNFRLWPINTNYQLEFVEAHRCWRWVAVALWPALVAASWGNIFSRGSNYGIYRPDRWTRGAKVFTGPYL